MTKTELQKLLDTCADEALTMVPSKDAVLYDMGDLLLGESDIPLFMEPDLYVVKVRCEGASLTDEDAAAKRWYLCKYPISARPQTISRLQANEELQDLSWSLAVCACEIWDGDRLPPAEDTVFFLASAPKDCSQPSERALDRLVRTRICGTADEKSREILASCGDLISRVNERLRVAVSQKYRRLEYIKQENDRLEASVQVI